MPDSRYNLVDLPATVQDHNFDRSNFRHWSDPYVASIAWGTNFAVLHVYLLLVLSRETLQVNRGRLTVMGERQRLGLRLLLEALQVDRGWFTVVGERQRLRGYWTLYFDWGWLFGLRLWLKAL
ncbi:hypothetical protein D3C86_1892750 [compost metagenome]